MCWDVLVLVGFVACEHDVFVLLEHEVAQKRSQSHSPLGAFRA